MGEHSSTSCGNRRTECFCCSRKEKFPEVFTVCAVTRSVSGAGCEEIDKGLVKGYTEVQLPDLPPSLSKSELIAAQQEDPELKDLFSQVKSREEMESIASGYLLSDNVLVRKRYPHD